MRKSLRIGATGLTHLRSLFPLPVISRFPIDIALNLCLICIGTTYASQTSGGKMSTNHDGPHRTSERDPDVVSLLERVERLERKQKPSWIVKLLGHEDMFSSLLISSCIVFSILLICGTVLGGIAITR